MAWSFAIITLLLNVNIVVCSDVNCNKEDIDGHVDVPLISKLEAPLKAELDIRALTKQIKSLIYTEIKKGIEQAINTTLETQLQSVKDDLGLQITDTILTSLKTIQEQNDQHLNSLNLIINSTSTHEIHRRIDALSNGQDIPAFTATFKENVMLDLVHGQITLISNLSSKHDVIVYKQNDQRLNNLYLITNSTTREIHRKIDELSNRHDVEDIITLRIFTVPRRGIYLAACTVRSASGRFLHVWLWKNNNQLGLAFGNNWTTDDGPAFTATFNTWTRTPLSRGEILKFDHVLLNRQNGYDSSTGYYTIPWPGVYLVTCTVRSISQKHLHVILHKDDKPLLWAYGRDYNTGSLEAVLKLDKGEKLCIKNDVADYVVGEEVQTGATSMFSVVYISK